MPEMDSTTSKTNVEEMDIDVVHDALNNSKRVKRSSDGSNSVEPSTIEDDLMEEIDISSPDIGMRLWKPMNSSYLRWQPKLSSSRSNSVEHGYSVMAQKRVGNVNGKNEVIISPDEGNSFPFQRSDMRIKGKEVEGKGNHRQNFPVRGLSISNGSIMRQPDEIADFPNKDKEVYSYLDAGFTSRMKGNSIVCGSNLQGKVDEVLSKPSYLSSSGFNTGRDKAISNENVEKIIYIDRSEGVSSHDLNSNYHCFDKKRGKLNLGDETPKDLQHGEPTIQSSRAASLFGKEVVTIAEEQGSPFGFHQNLGWRKAHKIKMNMNQLSHAYPSNHKEKLSSFHSPEWRQETDIEEQDHAHVHAICKSSHTTTLDYISNPHHDQAFPDPVVSRSHRLRKYVKGKKKCNSLLPLGETSSFLNQPSYHQSHTGTSNLKLDKSDKEKCQSTTLKEIDKVCPDVRCYSSHQQQSGISDSSIASASQIESDEAFARELQEQFYHEATRFIDMEKVDATIAWSLQQDEDAKAAALTWSGHSNSVLFDDIRSNFDGEVDLETRLDLLEAMEDELENNLLDYDDTASNDSLNDTDYAMQSNLDVSSSEINSLPLSLIQNDNNEEPCAVCLEIPTVGETMRHLPCLHKFHRMCIDTWLKKKPSCPVCKFNIS